MGNRENHKKKERQDEPILLSIYNDEEDLHDYLDLYGGYTAEEVDDEEENSPRDAAPAVRGSAPRYYPGGPLPHQDEQLCTLTTEHHETARQSTKKEGSDQLAQVILRTVAVRNIGGKLWARLSPPLYSPLEVDDIIEILRLLGKIPKSDRRVAQTCHDVYRCLMAFSEIKVPELPIYKGRILFENGWYDVAECRMTKPSEDDILIHRVNAALPRERVATPAWDAFLESVSGGDQSIQALILSMLGYLMLPEQDAKCFFVLGTAPDSGKSVLGHFLQRLFGTEFTSAVPLHNLKNEFALAPILGKKLNLSMDLPADSLSQTAVGNIKMLTGNDLVSINVKFESHRQQRITAKFVFGTDSPSILNHPDSAFWNRTVFVPFMNSIPKEQQKKNLLDELWKERHGIVQQGVMAARELLLNNYKFPQCKYADHMVRKWSQTEGHHVLDFVHDCCVLGDLTWYAGSSDLYLAYRRYCEGKDASPVSLAKFSRILSDHADSLNIRKHHRNDGWGFKGITENPKLE